MNATELMRTLAEHGADTEGILDRFMQDVDFYAERFERFLEDKNFRLLGQAIEEKDCRTAFAAAHSLKGLAGNMGLTFLQTVVNELVELLRAEQTEGLTARYEAVMSELAKLKHIYEG